MVMTTHKPGAHPQIPGTLLLLHAALVGKVDG